MTIQKLWTIKTFPQPVASDAKTEVAEIEDPFLRNYLLLHLKLFFCPAVRRHGSSSLLSLALEKNAVPAHWTMCPTLLFHRERSDPRTNPIPYFFHQHKQKGICFALVVLLSQFLCVRHRVFRQKLLFNLLS